jgi:hypothetical protein
MLELSNENLSTAKASNSLTTKAKSLVACGRLKPNSVIGFIFLDMITHILKMIVN